jgi:group I intron endonuclease
MGTIYLIINKINGFLYVGKTIQKLSYRKSRHKYAAETPTEESYLYRAIKKYGWENFAFIEWKQNVPIDLLGRAEERWVIFFDCLVPNGYNIQKPTQNTFLLSQETKEKISQALKGRRFTDATIQKMKKSHSGKKASEETKNKISNSLKGIKRSKETIQKMRNAQKGRKVSVETRKKISSNNKIRFKNSENHPQFKYSFLMKEEIRSLYFSKQNTVEELIRKYGISQTHIYRIINNDSGCGMSHKINYGESE